MLDHHRIAPVQQINGSCDRLRHLVLELAHDEARRRRAAVGDSDDVHLGATSSQADRERGGKRREPANRRRERAQDPDPEPGRDNWSNNGVADATTRTALLGGRSVEASDLHGATAVLLKRGDSPKEVYAQTTGDGARASFVVVIASALQIGLIVEGPLVGADDLPATDAVAPQE